MELVGRVNLCVLKRERVLTDGGRSVLAVTVLA